MILKWKSPHPQGAKVLDTNGNWRWVWRDTIDYAIHNAETFGTGQLTTGVVASLDDLRRLRRALDARWEAIAGKAQR